MNNNKLKLLFLFVLFYFYTFFFGAIFPLLIFYTDIFFYNETTQHFLKTLPFFPKTEWQKRPDLLGFTTIQKLSEATRLVIKNLVPIKFEKNPTKYVGRTETNNENMWKEIGNEGLFSFLLTNYFGSAG